VLFRSTFVEDYAKQMQARGPRNATTTAAKTTQATSAESVFTGVHN